MDDHSHLRSTDFGENKAAEPPTTNSSSSSSSRAAPPRMDPPGQKSRLSGGVISSVLSSATYLTDAAVEEGKYSKYPSMPTDRHPAEEYFDAVSTSSMLEPAVDTMLEDGSSNNNNLEYDNITVGYKLSISTPPTPANTRRGMKGRLIAIVIFLLIAIIIAIVIPVTSSNRNNDGSRRSSSGEIFNNNNNSTPQPTTALPNAPSTTAPIAALPTTASPTMAWPIDTCPPKPPVLLDSNLSYVRHDITWGGRVEAGECQNVAHSIVLGCGTFANRTSSAMIVPFPPTTTPSLSNDNVTCERKGEAEFLCQASSNVAATTNEERLNRVTLLCYGPILLDLDATVQVLQGTNECTALAITSRNEYWSVVSAKPHCPGDDDLTLDETSTTSNEPDFACSDNAELESLRANGGGETTTPYCTTQDVCRVLFGISACSVDHGGISLQTNVNPATCPRPFSLARVPGAACAADVLCDSNICVDGRCRAGPGCAGMDCHVDSHCREGLSCSLEGFCVVSLQAPSLSPTQSLSPTAGSPSALSTLESTMPPSNSPSTLSTANPTASPTPEPIDAPTASSSTNVPTPSPTFMPTARVACPVRPPDPTEPGSIEEGLWYVRHDITFGGQSQAGDCDPVAHRLGISCNGSVTLAIPSFGTTCVQQPTGNDWDVECQSNSANESSQVVLLCYGNNINTLNASMEVLAGTNECDTLAIVSRNEYWSLVTSSSECEGTTESSFSCSDTMATIEDQNFCTTLDVCRVFFGLFSCPVDFGGALLTTSVDSQTCPQGFSVSREEGEACMDDTMCASDICVDGICRSGPGCAGMDCEKDDHCRGTFRCVERFCA